MNRTLHYPLSGTNNSPPATSIWVITNELNHHNHKPNHNRIHSNKFKRRYSSRTVLLNLQLKSIRYRLLSIIMVIKRNYSKINKCFNSNNNSNITNKHARLVNNNICLHLNRLRYSDIWQLNIIYLWKIISIRSILMKGNIGRLWVLSILPVIRWHKLDHNLHSKDRRNQECKGSRESGREWGWIRSWT